eukprot:TRINITY_DN82769_c0_g1_i1.p1 TRINITY_DN82769_c0_g1~~TRINITY_DN82769_c0_g1_i1.p1  ORF type:complete len:452 (-),score=79.55 TRINITY_DN82769_c0_g1_i1:112-1467(-)
MDGGGVHVTHSHDDDGERQNLSKEELYSGDKMCFGMRKRRKAQRTKGTESRVCCPHICEGAFRVFVRDLSKDVDQEMVDYDCEVCYLLAHSGSLNDLLGSKGKFETVCMHCGTRQFRGEKCENCGVPFSRLIDASGVQSSIAKALCGREPESQTLAMGIIQGLLAEYVPKQTDMDVEEPFGSRTRAERDGKSEEDRSLFATYRDERKGEFGCKEYTRGCHMQCPDCMKYVCCRLCHDRADPSHKFRRKDVENMRCSYCGCEQPVAGRCVQCRARLSTYYCDVCHLFDCPNSRTQIFHCDKCGECRKAGIDKVFRHCDSCGVCVFEPHECFRYSLKESNCSICGERLFSAREQASFPPCGHWTHRSCLERYVRMVWSQHIIPRCPLCRRAVVDLVKVDAIIDRNVALDMMPKELREKTQTIICHECGKTSTVPFHYKFRKCPHCHHYNTQLL